MRVGRGRSPQASNMPAKAGMTFHKMTAITRAAMLTTATGYIMAPLIWLLSLTAFSM